MKKKLLIIENQPCLVKKFRGTLKYDFEVHIAREVKEAKKLLASGIFPAAIFDLDIFSFSHNARQGLAFLEEILSLSPCTRVIVISNKSDKEIAAKAIALGAIDFFLKPVDLHVLRIILARAFKIHELEQIDLQLRQQEHQMRGMCDMIGISPPMKKVFKLVRLAAEYDYPVLITGKTGTGKELAAKAIHQLSKRASKPFVTINCGAIPENLLESELFGYEKGAFTGALSRKIGKFEQANHGTIFLDEIGELPFSLQVKLLRFLQESTIERLGGTQTVPLNVRIISATNVDLEEGVKKGIFREDLFYRLNVIQLTLPELKERSEDIILLAQHFLIEESQRIGRRQPTFSTDALNAMVKYEWPGNVRELQNRIRRALAITRGKIITPLDLGFDESFQTETQRVPTLREAREKIEKDVIQWALALSGHNISLAARLLDISRPTLHGLLKKYDLKKKK